MPSSSWVRPKQQPNDEVEVFGLGEPDAEDDTGDILGGRYELLEVLACGGTATVYRARDRTTRSVVAVKVLYKGALAAVGEFFNQEARLAARIRSPHLVHASAGVSRGTGDPPLRGHGGEAEVDVARLYRGVRALHGHTCVVERVSRQLWRLRLAGASDPASPHHRRLIAEPPTPYSLGAGDDYAEQDPELSAQAVEEVASIRGRLAIAEEHAADVVANRESSPRSRTRSASPCCATT